MIADITDKVAATASLAAVTIFMTVNGAIAVQQLLLQNSFHGEVLLRRGFDGIVVDSGGVGKQQTRFPFFDFVLTFETGKSDAD